MTDNRYKGNRLWSEIGSGMHFEKEGFKYSKRYYNCLSDRDNLDVLLYKNIYCPECNGEY